VHGELLRKLQLKVGTDRRNAFSTRNVQHSGLRDSVTADFSGRVTAYGANIRTNRMANCYAIDSLYFDRGKLSAMCGHCMSVQTQSITPIRLDLADFLLG